MKRLTIPLLAILLAGCRLFHPELHKTPLTNRYNQLKGFDKKNNEDRVIDVSAISIPAEIADTSSNIGKSVFDLQGQGQKAVIEAFSKKDKDGQDRAKTLLNDHYQQKKAKITPAYVKQDFNLIFTTELKDFFFPTDFSITEGDRIVKLRITVTIPEEMKANLRFIKWNQFTTQFGQFNIGATSFNVAKAATFTPSVAVGTALTVSAGSVGNTSTYQEADTLQSRFILLSGKLTPTTLSLTQTGTPQIDLAGNTAVTLTVAFPFVENSETYTVDGLRDNDGAFQPPNKITLKPSGFAYPQILNNIELPITTDYVFRHIVGGVRSFAESDDTIRYFYGTFKGTLLLASAADFKVKTWCVSNDGKPLCLFDEASGQIHEIDFSSNVDAASFLDWVYHVVKKDVANKIVDIGGLDLAVPDVIRQPRSTAIYLNHINVGDLQVVQNP